MIGMVGRQYGIYSQRVEDKESNEMMDQNQICDNLKKDDHAEYETFASIYKTKINK